MEFFDPTTFEDPQPLRLLLWSLGREMAPLLALAGLAALYWFIWGVWPTRGAKGTPKPGRIRLGLAAVLFAFGGLTALAFSSPDAAPALLILGSFWILATLAHIATLVWRATDGPERLPGASTTRRPRSTGSIVSPTLGRP